jgi:hypothetical protein
MNMTASDNGRLVVNRDRQRWLTIEYASRLIFQIIR